MSFIESLWIINCDGTQFYKFANQKEDDKCIVDFFVALQQFAFKMTENIDTEIKSTQIGKFKYFFSIDHENKIYFIIKTSKMNVKAKFVNKKLLDIKSTFLSEYEIYLEFIKKKNVKEINTKIFESFTEKLIDLIPENPATMIMKTI